jgi:NAD(P)H-dependent FMN reductase
MWKLKVMRNKPLAAVGYSGGVAAGTRAVEHLMAIGIEAEMVPLRQTVLIPKVETAFDDAGVPLDPGTSVALSVMLDDLAWWSALLADGRARGELLPAVFRVRAALAALQPDQHHAARRTGS